ncbi:MAG: hypothetical protein MIO90_02350, partial [Methanomassiliicoccales archaeon]|nr:hypothetical protein [Methanomassiliicoccales archaeon]
MLVIETTDKITSHGHDGYEAFDIYEDDGDEGTQVSRTYRGYVRRKRLLLGASLVALVLCVIIASLSGPIDIPFADVIRYLFTFDTSGRGGVIWNIRRVRIVGALLAGA